MDEPPPDLVIPPPPSDGREYSPSPRIFVGDLSFFCSEDDLRILFAQYGPVLQAEIRRGEDNNGSLMHGFVEMASGEDAGRAAAELDGRKFMGRTMRVVIGGNNNRQGGRNERQSWAQIHVSFVTRRLDIVVNEELLYTVFSAYGTVMDVTIKRHNMDQDRRNQNGYGFTFFATRNEANRAVSGIKNATLNGITFDCSITHRSENMSKRHDNSPSSTSSTASISHSNSSNMSMSPQAGFSSPGQTHHPPRPRSASFTASRGALIPSQPPTPPSNYSQSLPGSFRSPFLSPPMAYQPNFGATFPPYQAQYGHHVTLSPPMVDYQHPYGMNASNMAMNYPNYHPQPLMANPNPPNNPEYRTFTPTPHMDYHHHASFMNPPIHPGYAMNDPHRMPGYHNGPPPSYSTMIPPSSQRRSPIYNFARNAHARAQQSPAISYPSHPGPSHSHHHSRPDRSSVPAGRSDRTNTDSSGTAASSSSDPHDQDTS